MADKGYLALFVNHAVEKTPSATPRGRRQASQRRMRFIYGGGSSERTPLLWRLMPPTYLESVASDPSRV